MLLLSIPGTDLSSHTSNRQAKLCSALRSALHGQSYQQEIAVTWEVNTVPQWSWYSRFSPDYDYAGFATGNASAWNMLAIKMSSGKTSTARTGFYSVNGSTWASDYTSRSNTALLAAGTIRVGAGYAGVVDVGFINSVYCYNKMLTDAEIAQNYAALRKKFGV